MLKKLELSTPNSCLSKADPNEPVFVLRAKDPLAPQAIRHWAAMAVDFHEPDKIAEALQAADMMEAWQREQPKVISASVARGDGFDGRGVPRR